MRWGLRNRQSMVVVVVSALLAIAGAAGTASAASGPRPASAILGSGTVAGKGYHVVAVSNGRRTPCFGVELENGLGVGTHNDLVQECLTNDVRPLGGGYFSPDLFGAANALAPQAQIVAEGIAGRHVHHMWARFRRSTPHGLGARVNPKVHVFTLTARKAHRFGLRHPVHYFVSFFPPGLIPPPSHRHQRITEDLIKPTAKTIVFHALDVHFNLRRVRGVNEHRYIDSLEYSPPPGYSSPDRN